MKDELRKKYQKLRIELKNKDLKDSNISQVFLASDIYKNSSLILCYYSTSYEINTKTIIKKALDDGKKVAIPKCLDKSGNMAFYCIKSLNDVRRGLFNIMEPISCEEINDFKNAIIIVPGFTFDKKGYRLGYGKGYYDRFLNNRDMVKIGFCYKEFLTEKLPINTYDQKVDYIVLENEIIFTSNKVKVML